MELPPLLVLDSVEDYREHYIKTLVNGPLVTTPDGTVVVFYESVFHHAFSGYSSKWSAVKDRFDFQRAQRMDWVRSVLTDPLSESYREEVTVRKIHRIVLATNNRYIVVTELLPNGKEKFITAFPCGADKVAGVRKYPRWRKTK